MSTCPICSSGDSRPLFNLARVPLQNVVIIHNPAEAKAYPVGELAIHGCRRCGHLFNREFDQRKVDYTAHSEESQACSQKYRSFAIKQAEELRDRYELFGKRIVEIGCGKGEFLTQLCQLGDNIGIGIDPGPIPDSLRQSNRERVHYVSGFFEEHTDLVQDADCIICRHTLEHISQPLRLLQHLRQAVGSRPIPIFFTVPDNRRILREGAFWDLYYEHCGYFSWQSLVKLFKESGFLIEEISRTYDDQHLQLFGLVNVEGVPPSRPQNGDEPLLVWNDLDAMSDHFCDRSSQKVTYWQSRLQKHADCAQRVVLWGGGSKAVAFLSAMNNHPTIVAVVDINPNKTATYLPASGCRVISPDQLTEVQPAEVIIMNPVYESEIRVELLKNAIDCTLSSLH
ncbi:MAG: methyltransferase domain-containing protein [Magnetococcales bacterium]|nr:methyltransferase domain-containing protein [Magnetococcales bacterium]